MARLDINPRVDFPRLFLRRGLMATTLVFGTYNPSGYSYYHWLTQGDGFSTPKLFIGIALLTGLVALARMAFLSIGYFGITALSVMVLMSLAAGVGLGFFGFGDVHVTTYFVLFWIAMVLGVGTSWSFVQKRISGERDVLRTPP